MGSLSIWHWLIVLLVVVLIFGTKKLRNLGGDVGGAVKSFKDAMDEGKNAPETENKSNVVVANNDETQLIAAKAVEAPVAKTATKKKAAATKKPAAAKTAATKPTAVKSTATKPATAKPKTTAKKTSPAKPKAATAKKSESQSNQ